VPSGLALSMTPGRCSDNSLRAASGETPKCWANSFDLVAAERSAQLIGRNRQIGAAAEPRLNLIAEAALLQLSGEALQVTEIRLRQHRRDEGRHRGRLNLAEATAERAGQTIQKSHGLLLLMKMLDRPR
jgi:hypothetical protein